jgi:predicted nucleotidyltransferase
VAGSAVRSATRAYLAAARLVARVLDGAPVRTVYVRRSVAADDTAWLRSDLDLALVIDAADGATMARLHRRVRRARLVFPRLGEVQVTTPGELHELAESDPFRASIDRRAAVVVRGDPLAIPPAPIGTRDALRRLVFWLDHYVPWAARRGRRRDQRKFVLEMWNALGVLEGRWPEPLVSRREVGQRWRADGARDVAAEAATPFVTCLRIAERAHAHGVGGHSAHALPSRAVPVIDRPVVVDGARPLVLLPTPDSPWPGAAHGDGALVVTPTALDLLLETQLPTLWLDAGPALAALGFEAPSCEAWLTTCRRQSDGARLRLPGFSEAGPGRHAQRLARIERVVAWLDAGGTAAPAAEARDAEARDAEAHHAEAHHAAPASVTAYYERDFDALLARATALRARVDALAAEVARTQLSA